MKEKIKRIGMKIGAFFKKYGFDAVLALIVFNFPMYAVFFIKSPEFRIFAAWWTGIWWGLGPITPGWAVTVILAIFLRWLRLGIWKGILWLREAMIKLQLQNQLATYLTAEEIKMILEMARRVSHESDMKLRTFKEELRKERLQMIDDQWSKTMEELPPEVLEIEDNEKNQDE